jgi:heat shock protein HslJ
MFRRTLLIGLMTAALLAACNGASAQPTGENLTDEPTEEPTEPATSEPGANDLAGSVWVLTEINGAAPIEGTNFTLAFTSETELGGNACNGFGGTYIVEGNTIQIQELMSTMMACMDPEGIMEQEQAYLDLLGKAATYELSGDRLVIGTADNASALVFAAGEPAPAPTSELEGTAWVLAEMNGTAPVAGTEITLMFEADSLSGKACNQYNAGYSIEPGSVAISISPVVSTKMACTEPAGTMEQEGAYFAALEATSTYILDGDRLELRGEDGTTVLVLTTNSGGTVSFTNLAGTSWLLTSLNGSSPIEGADITLGFDDARLFGKGGCNEYSGPYTVGTDGRFAATEIVSTDMACGEPAGLMDQEIAYFQALSKVTMFVIEGDELQMFGEDGTLLAFSRQG